MPLCERHDYRGQNWINNLKPQPRVSLRSCAKVPTEQGYICLLWVQTYQAFAVVFKPCNKRPRRGPKKTVRSRQKKGVCYKQGSFGLLNHLFCQHVIPFFCFYNVFALKFCNLVLVSNILHKYGFKSCSNAWILRTKSLQTRKMSNIMLK